MSCRPQYGLIEPRISRSNCVVRALSSRGGSNAPRSALSVVIDDTAVIYNFGDLVLRRIGDKSSFVSPRSRKNSRYSFRCFCTQFRLTYANFYLTAQITTVCSADACFLCCIPDMAYYDHQNVIFALNSWHYYKLECRIGQLQLISSKCCPAPPEA